MAEGLRGVLAADDDQLALAQDQDVFPVVDGV